MTAQAPSPLRAAALGGGALAIEPAVLDRLMPLHLVVAMDGTIRHAGPTLKKICPQSPLPGSSLLHHFDLRRPREIESVADLADPANGPLRLTLRDAERTAFKGQAVPIAAGQAMLIDLSFGIAAIEAVARFRLTAADFAATDLTVEMLFLVEAQRATLAETQRVNGQRQSQRRAADLEAATDPVTGLRNRAALVNLVIRLVGQDTPFGLIHLDVSNLPACPHPGPTGSQSARDGALCDIAVRLSDNVRARDVVARIADTEFAVLLHGMTHVTRLSGLVDRLKDALAAPLGAADAATGASSAPHVCFGVTATGLHPRPGALAILSAADIALAEARKGGPGSVAFAPDP